MHGPTRLVHTERIPIRWGDMDARMNDVLYADGAAKIVWIDLKRGKAIPLPESIAALSVRPTHP